jgi:Fuc2NAc and GlcNAc transferase
MNYVAIWVIVGAFLVAAVATGLMRSYALQKELLDIPNSRSSHSSPTPRGGGVAIVAAFLVGVLAIAFARELSLAVATALVAGGGAIAAVGFLDDRRALRASVRFVVQLGAALVVVSLLGGISDRTLAQWGLHGHGVWLGATFAVLALVWVTNLFNFMDGIDGIAASESAFIAGAAAWIYWYHGGDAGLTISMLCLAAASLGFLKWNWPPARIFMGDVGSGFIGFSLAALGLATSRPGIVPIEVWVILAGVFLVDATVTLIRRVARGDRWFEAHRIHAYQHLARRWNSHIPVTMLVIFINIVWLLPWALIAAGFPTRAPLSVAAALIPLVALFLACGSGAKER